MQARPGVACGGTISDAWGGLGPIAAPRSGILIKESEINRYSRC